MNRNATAFRDPWAANGFNELYQVPTRVEPAVKNSLKLNETGVIAYPITNGPHLQTYVHITQSSTLFVIFHGAVRISVDTYPRFDRVTTMKKNGNSFVSFADPTLVIDPEITLGWYIGTEDWDPQNVILQVIQEAATTSGASNIVFIGGSGGGFAALKYSLHFPGSLAFVFSPQTDVARYRGGSFPRLREKGFNSDSEETLKRTYPGRFEVISQYSEPVSHDIYYYQNLTDPDHIERQYLPFLRAVGIFKAMGSNSAGNIQAVLVPQERTGHGAPTAREFDEHLAKALEMHSREPTCNTTSLHEQIQNLHGLVEESITANGKIYRALSRELGILPWSIETYKRLAESLVPKGAPLPPAGSYAVRAAGADEISRLIRRSAPENVVECGSGSSTAWIASTLEKCGKGRVYSLEHDPYYAQQTRDLLSGLGLQHRAEVIEAPLEQRIAQDGAETPWYAGSSRQHLPEHIDVLFVDGPPGNTGPRVRRSAWEVLGDRLSPGSLLAVDDAQRPQEAAILKEWEEDPRLLRVNGYHDIVVLEVRQGDDALD